MRLKKCEQNRLNHHETLATSDLGVGAIKVWVGILDHQQACIMFKNTLSLPNDFSLEKHRGGVDILIAILEFVEYL